MESTLKRIFKVSTNDLPTLSLWMNLWTMWTPKMLFKHTDGGEESGVTAYTFIEWKKVLTISLLHFKKDHTERFHTHAFDAVTYYFNGHATETQIDGTIREHTRGWKMTPRRLFHKVETKGGSWCLTFRGPWQNLWMELRGDEQTLLTHKRQVVKTLSIPHTEFVNLYIRTCVFDRLMNAMLNKGHLSIEDDVSLTLCKALSEFCPTENEPTEEQVEDVASGGEEYAGFVSGMIRERKMAISERRLRDPVLVEKVFDTFVKLRVNRFQTLLTRAETETFPEMMFFKDDPDHTESILLEAILKHYPDYEMDLYKFPHNLHARAVNNWAARKCFPSFFGEDGTPVQGEMQRTVVNQLRDDADPHKLVDVFNRKLAEMQERGVDMSNDDTAQILSEQYQDDLPEEVWYIFTPKEDDGNESDDSGEYEIPHYDEKANEQTDDDDDDSDACGECEICRRDEVKYEPTDDSEEECENKNEVDEKTDDECKACNEKSALFWKKSETSDVD